MTVDDAVLEAIEETKGSFDLGAMLKGRPIRVKTKRVYTDEIAGERLGGSETQFNSIGMPVATRRWGVMGDLDALSAELDALKALEIPTEDQQARIEAIGAEVVALGKTAAGILDELNSTALDIEVQSLPPIIQKDARRKARLQLGINGPIPQNDPEKKQEYLDEYTAQILASSVVSITSVGTGEKNVGLDAEGARNLLSFLPGSEVAKVDELLEEIVFRSAIASNLASDADFSPGI